MSSARRGAFAVISALGEIMENAKEGYRAAQQHRRSQPLHPRSGRGWAPVRPDGRGSTRSASRRWRTGYRSSLIGSTRWRRCRSACGLMSASARTGADQRRRAFPRGHGLLGHQASPHWLARHRRAEIEAVGGQPQRLYLARKHRVLRQGAEADIGLLLDILAAYPAHLTFEPAELERERTVILGGDRPSQRHAGRHRLRSASRNALYPDQAMGGPTQASPEIIRKDCRGNRLEQAISTTIAGARQAGAVGGQVISSMTDRRACRQAAWRHAGGAVGVDRGGALCRR